MMFYVSQDAQREFSANLRDWCDGGPLLGGWTRTGNPIRVVFARLLSYSLTCLDVDSVLEKNPAEVARWHMDFLKNHSNLEKTNYYNEYLLPRYNIEKAKCKAAKFLSLLNDIKLNGIKKPIWVADVSTLGLGLRYFRFNGCHRTCCAKYLGIKFVPVLMFKSELLYYS
jgi:hypothetical protein